VAITVIDDYITLCFQIFSLENKTGKKIMGAKLQQNVVRVQK